MNARLWPARKGKGTGERWCLGVRDVEMQDPTPTTHIRLVLKSTMEVRHRRRTAGGEAVEAMLGRRGDGDWRYIDIVQCLERSDYFAER